MDIDIKSKCRVCLGDDENMVSLFESNNSTLLCEKMMRCAKVHVSEDDGGPTQICQKCLEDLSNALEFKEKCELNDKKIRSIIQHLLDKPKVTEPELEILKPESSDEVKSSGKLNIKEEINNDYDNSYDFFDSALDLKNEFLDGLKIEFDSEENHIITKSTKFYTKSRGIQDSKNILDCEDSLIIKRKRRKKKLRKRELKENSKIEVTIPKKRGRKPKLLQNLEYTHDEDIMKVLNNELQCNICKKMFPDIKSFKSHVKIHSKTRDHTCDQCGKQFKYKDNLKVHSMTHTGEKPYKCDLCDKSFSKKDNLAIHRKRHLKERNYSCEQCGSSYYTSYELKTHMRVHTGEKPHVCTLCGKRFTAKNNLYIHQRSHTGEKPHVCTVCGKQFTSKNILSIHSRIHTGEKPYICSVCGKRFTANKLAVHMRTHTGEKPHVCPLCGKQFSATNVLVIHMRRHTGEKPYECKMCGQTYGHTQSLNKHMRKQHKMVTNAVQIQMQQINEAHRALLEERTDPMIVAKESNNSPSPTSDTSQCPQVSLTMDSKHLNVHNTADLGSACVPHEVLKMA